MEDAKLMRVLMFITAWIILAGLVALIALGHNGAMTNTFCGLAVVFFGKTMYDSVAKPLIERRKRKGV